ncbi:MAG: blue light sensor protein, partial [Rhodobacteraceae bacterium]|nr:blue light sensor protein [Paracoccaceae bacterium]
SWMWSREEIADGALENVSASEAFALFLRHAKELL